jgi:hypothetical protein
MAITTNSFVVLVNLTNVLCFGMIVACFVLLSEMLQITLYGIYPN